MGGNYRITQVRTNSKDIVPHKCRLAFNSKAEFILQYTDTKSPYCWNSRSNFLLRCDLSALQKVGNKKIIQNSRCPETTCMLK